MRRSNLAHLPGFLAAVLAMCLAACGAEPGSHATPQTRGTGGPSALPAGFTAYDGGDLGFRLGLAPGWMEGVRDQQGVSFSDPARGGVMLVHVDSAQAPDLQVAAAQLMISLTGGAAGSARTGADASLAGLPARRVGATYQLLSSTQRVDAFVMLDGPRAWAVALVAPQEAYDSDRDDFQRMAASFALSTHQPSPPARAALGLPAPLFDLAGPAGRVRLDLFKGPVVVNFFATWCAPCRQEMPLLASRAAASSGRFAVIGVDTHDESAAVPAFLRELGVGFPVGYDTGGEVGDRYQIPGVPATFFLDTRHVLRRSVLGPLSPDALQQGLQAAGTR